MSKTWMVWYDNDKTKSLTRRIQDASEHFAKKYGRKAITCEVNINEDVKSYTGEITVTGKRSILPNHYYISGEP